MLELLAMSLIMTQPVDQVHSWHFDHPVAQGFEDFGLLSVDPLVPRADLRLPDAWDRVYQMSSDSGDLFARRRGNLTAVFPQSDYVTTENGPLAVVPPGTIYVIGEPGPWLLQQFGLDDGLGELTLPTRIDMSLVPVTLAAAPAPDVVSDELDRARRAASPWFNDQVRQRRMHARMDELIK